MERQILIPHLVNGVENYLRVKIQDEQRLQLLQHGFEINNGFLIWDYTYMMSESDLVHTVGHNDQQILQEILKIQL